MLCRSLASLNELEEDNRKEAERKERTRCERESVVSVEGSSASKEVVSPRWLSSSFPNSF